MIRHPLADGRKRQRYVCRLIRTRSVQRQPRQIAGAAAGVAVSWQVERVGELPFLRLVAPLNGRRTGDVVGLTVRANRRGSCGPVFMMSRGRGRLRRLLEWIAKQSKSQDAPPIVPVSNTQHNFGRFGCLHARRNCLCIPPVLLICKTARVWPFRGTDNLEVLAEGGQVPARGNRRPRQTFVFKAGERRLAIPRPFLERPEVSTAPKFIHPLARRHRLEKVQNGAAGHPERRCRLFRRAARSVAARHTSGLCHRLGHP